jgi:hypothetical protein
VGWSGCAARIHNVHTGQTRKNSKNRKTSSHEQELVHGLTRLRSGTVPRPFTEHPPPATPKARTYKRKSRAKDPSQLKRRKRDPNATGDAAQKKARSVWNTTTIGYLLEEAVVLAKDGLQTNAQNFENKHLALICTLMNKRFEVIGFYSPKSLRNQLDKMKRPWREWQAHLKRTSDWNRKDGEAPQAPDEVEEEYFDAHPASWPFRRAMPEWHERLEILLGERLPSRNAALEDHTLAESIEEDEDGDTAPAAGSAAGFEAQNVEDAQDSDAPPSSAASMRRRVLGGNNLRRRATLNSSSSSPHTRDDRDPIVKFLEVVLDVIADRYEKPKPIGTPLSELIRRLCRHQYVKSLPDKRRMWLFVEVSKPPHTDILYACRDRDLELYVRQLVADADAEAVRDASHVAAARDALQISRPLPPAAARSSDQSSQYQSFAFQMLQGDYPPQSDGSPMYYERGNGA